MKVRRNGATLEERAVKILFPLIFIAAGLVGVVAAVREDFRARESLAWTPTPAVIEAVQVTRNTFAIRYRYQAVGATHRSGQSHFGAASRGFHHEMGGRYLGKAGQSVTVYVDPDDPARAVLAPGRKPGWFVMPGFGLLFLAVGIGMWSLFRRGP